MRQDTDRHTLPNPEQNKEIAWRVTVRGFTSSPSIYNSTDTIASSQLMSPHRIHQYFETASDPTSWNILQFLETIPSPELCDTPTFFRQIDSYLKSLEVISEEDNERGIKAHCLLHLYREVSVLFLSGEMNGDLLGSSPALGHR